MIYNAGFVDPACGEEVHARGERDPSDLLSSPHVPLRCLAFPGGAIPGPDCDAAAENSAALVE